MWKKLFVLVLAGVGSIAAQAESASDVLLLPAGYCALGQSHPADLAMEAKLASINRDKDSPSVGHYFVRCEDLHKVREGHSAFGFGGKVSIVDLASYKIPSDVAMQTMLDAFSLVIGRSASGITEPLPIASEYEFTTAAARLGTALEKRVLSEKSGYITGDFRLPDAKNESGPTKYAFMVERRNDMLFMVFIRRERGIGSDENIELAKAIIQLNKKRFIVASGPPRY